jgi:2-keto-3-deoxy-L-rhamnonate aldolase RhmA
MGWNGTKSLLGDGGTAVGTWVCSSDPMMTEVVADAGFDFVVIDTEHVAQTALSLQGNLMALKDTPATPIVRVLWNDFVRVKQALDLGAEGIVFPWVNTAEEAVAAVRATRYPPEGVRGFGPRRAQRAADSIQDYFQHAAENILVLPQIETAQAVENAEAIAAVEGVDALLIGPADLSINLGVPLDLDCQAFADAVRQVARAATDAGKAFGVITVGAELACRWLAEGARMIIAGSDHALMRAKLDETLAAIRQAQAAR